MCLQHFGQLSEDLVVEPSSIPWESASLHPLKVCWRLPLGCSIIAHSQTAGEGSGDRETCPIWRGWGSTAFPMGSSGYPQLMLQMTVPYQVGQLPCWLCGTSSILITCATTSSSLPLNLAQNHGTSSHLGLLFLPGILLDSPDNQSVVRGIAQSQCGCSTSNLKWKPVPYSLPVSRRSCIKIYTYLYRSIELTYVPAPKATEEKKDHTCAGLCLKVNYWYSRQTSV